MSSVLVINAAGRETRVALVENGHIAEFYLERKKDKGVVGNIYKGRVVRVLPGMQAAFVDIGLEKAAFLYVSDVFYDPEFSRAQFELTEGEHEEAPDVPDEEAFTSAEAEPAPEVLGARTITGEYAVGALDAVGEGASSALEPVAPAAGAVSNLALTGAEHPPIAVSEAISHPDQAQVGTAPSVLATEEPPTAPGTGSGAPALDSPVDQPQVLDGASAEDASARSQSQEPEGPAGTAEGSPAEVRGERRGPRDRGERRRGREDRDRGDRDRGGRDRGERGDRGERDRGDRNRDRGDRDRGDRDRGDRRDEERPQSRKPARIEDLLKVGQEVLVQISKDPIGTKGARLTSHISIPGRHLVFMPTVDHVGISRRISNEKERRRLREIVDRLRPPGTGFIVRTVAENVPQEKLESDIRFLLEVWKETLRRNEQTSKPGLMHPDLDLILRATRDLFAQDIEKLVVDDREEYERICSFVAAQDAALKERVILHEGDEPVFDAYGIEQEIQRALQRKVWLKSGGYLIIDQAEALTAIDVNSGRYVGKKSLEETITKINVEAAKEIVYQLRLRNIGGIIICDFIDMEKQSNREKVFKTLQEALGRDKAKTNVLRISELGLVEMTRKRVRESIGRTLHQDCPYCDGKGFVKTPTTVSYEIFHHIRRDGPNFKDPVLVINCHPEVAKLLQGEERQELRHLMDRFNKTIQVRSQPNYHQEQYDIYGRPVQGHDRRPSGSESDHGREGGRAEAREARGPNGGGSGGRHAEADARRGEPRRGAGSSEERTTGPGGAPVLAGAKVP